MVLFCFWLGIITPITFSLPRTLKYTAMGYVKKIAIINVFLYPTVLSSILVLIWKYYLYAYINHPALRVGFVLSIIAYFFLKNKDDMVTDYNNWIYMHLTDKGKENFPLT